MIIVAALLTALACQQPPTATPPPAPAQPLIRLPSGIDWSKEPAPAPTAPAAATPSVADLFRERAAREASAKATENAPSADADGQFHCRRTETGTTCGNDEEAMRRLEAESAERRRRLETPN